MKALENTGARTMSAKFTPGPWWIGEPTGFINQVSIQPCIGVVYGAGDEIKANAALIAAAPDMYEALRELVDDVCDRVDLDSPSCNPGIKTAVKFARAALAKAAAVELIARPKVKK